MFNFFKKFLEQAGKEASQEYAINQHRPGLSTKNFDNSPKPVSSGPWIGVDLDGTLAVYTNNSSVQTVGEPVPAMVSLVKKMIRNGIQVKIFTARASDPEQFLIIRKWMKTHGLPELEITNIKDYYMTRLYDDRCIQVEKNTGRLITQKNDDVLEES